MPSNGLAGCGIVEHTGHAVFSSLSLKYENIHGRQNECKHSFIVQASIK
jgi:hypothetical protein